MIQIVVQAEYDCPFCQVEAVMDVKAKIDCMTRQTVVCDDCGGGFDVVVNLEVDVWAEIPRVIAYCPIDDSDIPF